MSEIGVDVIDHFIEQCRARGLAGEALETMAESLDKTREQAANNTLLLQYWDDIEAALRSSGPVAARLKKMAAIIDRFDAAYAAATGVRRA